MADSNNMRVLLMTGLAPPDKHASKTEQEQVDFFKKGFGDDVPIDQYGWKDTTGLIAAVKKYPDAIVVLYSAGGKRADKIAPIIKTKEKLFVVEPWCGEKTQSSERIKIMTTAMSQGVPPTNFQSGPVFNRGKGIPGSTSTPTGDGHFAALTYAGERIRSMYPDGVVEEPITQTVLDEPTYIVYTTNSIIDGEIIFTLQEEGYGGELYLSNFPDDLNIDLKGKNNKFFYTNFIDDPDFDRLKDALIKRGNEWLDGLSAFDGNENFDAGEIKIGALNGERYKIQGVVVDESTNIEIAGALIKDSTLDPSETKTNPDGSFILNGYYEKTKKPSKNPIYNITVDNNPTIKGTIQFEKTTATLRLTGETPDQKPITITNSLFFNKKGKIGGVEIDDPSIDNKNNEDSIDAFEEASNDLIDLAEIDLLNSLQYVTSLSKTLQPPSKKPPTPDFTLTVSSEGYGQKTNLSPFNLRGKIKSTMGVITLLSNKLELEQTILEETPLTDPQMKAIEIAKMSPEMAIQKAMNRIILEAKTRLLPAVLVMIGEFGITNIQAVLGKSYEDMNATCPIDLGESGDNLARLNKLIERKNNLTRALNRMYNALEKIELGVSIADKALVAAEVVVITLQALAAIPSTVATPIPSAVSNVVEEIKRQIKKFKLITGSTLMVLNILIQIIEKILQYLALLDTLLNGCIQDFLDDNPDADLAIQQQINNDLLEATKKQSEQLSPVVTNVNGFDMDVITENGKTEFDLKRRRAVAKNKAGIIMLKGEPSFSSNDQILIDELVFYIKQNDLKAE